MALKTAEIQKMVKDAGLETVLTQTDFDYVQYDEHSIAIPVMVEGKECYAKVTIVCGQLKDTKTSKAFDPYVAQEEWEIDKEFKAKVKAEKEKAKADKIAKSKK
jgi:ligand-binding sensor protein